MPTARSNSCVVLCPKTSAQVVVQQVSYSNKCTRTALEAVRIPTVWVCFMFVKIKDQRVGLPQLTRECQYHTLTSAKMVLRGSLQRAATNSKTPSRGFSASYENVVIFIDRANAFTPSSLQHLSCTYLNATSTRHT